MGWSPNYQPIREPELLDEFFLSVGKALYIACSFEHKCRWLLKCTDLIELHEKTKDIEASLLLVRALRDRALMETIRKMGVRMTHAQEDKNTLERAKNARNRIAHHIAMVGDLSLASARTIGEHQNELQSLLNILIAGDNLVSRWVYEVSEREPAPEGIQRAYPRLVRGWVFGREDNDHSHEDEAS